MAKILTIKLKENIVDIKSHLPEGMTEAEVNEHLTIALPMTVAGLAQEMSDDSPLAARATLLSMFEMADHLLTEMMEDDDDESDDKPPRCCEGAGCCNDHC
jgi:hypothetical protein